MIPVYNYEESLYTPKHWIIYERGSRRVMIPVYNYEESLYTPKHWILYERVKRGTVFDRFMVPHPTAKMLSVIHVKSDETDYDLFAVVWYLP